MAASASARCLPFLSAEQHSRLHSRLALAMRIKASGSPVIGLVAAGTRPAKSVAFSFYPVSSQKINETLISKKVRE